MPKTLAELEARQDKVWQRMLDIRDAAENQNRDLTKSELNTWRASESELREVSDQIKQTERQSAAEGARGKAGEQRTSRLLSPADIPQDELRGMHEALRSGRPYRVEARDLTGDGDPMVTTGRFAASAYVDQPRIANLFGIEKTTGATVRAYAASTAASAGEVAEGGTKPSAGMALTPIDVPMQKIATWQRISWELATDFGQFVQQIGTELTRAVISQENASLSTTLTAADLETQTSAGDVGVDSTAEAIATLEASGIQPDSIVMAPSRLAKIRKATTTGSGQYLADPLTAQPSGLHGLPITVSPEMADTTILVGSFRQAGVVYLREAVSIRTGLDGSDFSENMISIVCEERLGLAVVQPKRVVNIDVTG